MRGRSSVKQKVELNVFLRMFLKYCGAMSRRTTSPPSLIPGAFQIRLLLLYFRRGLIIYCFENAPGVELSGGPSWRSDYFTSSD